MDTLTKARIAKLEALNYCPACGSVSKRTSGRAGQFNAFFVCGAHFSTETGRAIVAELACPNPSIVAAAHLEVEVAAAVAAEQAFPAGIDLATV